MAHVKLAASIAEAEAYLAENPKINSVLLPCYCDAQYCSIYCSCLPGRVSEAKGKLAKMDLVQVTSSITKHNTYDYQHHVDNCACGTCYKARMDSGTQGASKKTNDMTK
jgi:hypothetical protein